METRNLRVATLFPMLINGLVREVAHPREDSIYINGGGVMVIFTTPEFAKAYPKITKAYTNLQIKTQQWLLANPDEASKLVEGVTRVPANISSFGWSRWSSGWGSTDLKLETIVKEAKDLQDWLVAHGDIDANKQVNPADLFDPQFFN